MELAELIEDTDEVDYLTYRCRWWVRPINTRRAEQGASVNLVQEMRYEDDESFFNFTRMTFVQFDELLRLIGPKIQKFCISRETVTPETRILVTLR